MIMYVRNERLCKYFVELNEEHIIFFNNNQFADDKRREAGEAGAVAAIVSALTHHKDVAPIMVAACRALVHVLKNGMTIEYIY